MHAHSTTGTHLFCAVLVTALKPNGEPPLSQLPSVEAFDIDDPLAFHPYCPSLRASNTAGLHRFAIRYGLTKLTAIKLQEAWQKGRDRSQRTYAIAI